MRVTMGKQKKGADDAYTTLKARHDLAAKVGQIGSMTGKTIPEVLDMFERVIDEELLRLMAQRQAELERQMRERKGKG